MYLYKSRDLAFSNAGFYIGGQFCLSNDLTSKKTEYVSYSIPGAGYDGKGRMVEVCYNLWL